MDIMETLWTNHVKDFDHVFFRGTAIELHRCDCNPSMTIHHFPLVEVRSMGARLHSHYPEIGTTLAVWRPGAKQMEGQRRIGTEQSCVPYKKGMFFSWGCALVGRFSGFLLHVFSLTKWIFFWKTGCFVRGVLVILSTIYVHRTTS